MNSTLALLVSWCVCATTTSLLLYRCHAPAVLWGWLLLVMAGTLLWQYHALVKPARKRMRLLDKQNHHLLLQQFTDDTTFADPELNAIRELFDSYTADLVRGHSVTLLDKQAQIHALQSQINPHFLYNTLESIRGQALMEGNREIAAMAEALAAFFRYNISQKSYLVTLREELANVKNYFSIQEYRFNNRFRLEVIVCCEQDALDCYIPKLTIQPIVENAIFHGLETKGERGKVVITIDVTEQRLLITVSDDGMGMDEAVLEKLNRKIHTSVPVMPEETKGTGIALINVNKRIELVFGNEYGINVYSTKGLGTDVEVVVPLLTEKGGHDSI